VVGGLEPQDPLLIGSYRLIGRLGSGGMGRVFLGLSAGGRRVAVKVIRAELAADQEFRVRFGREVAAARRVSGLFTALVVDADVDGPVPWLATAYVAGPSLAQAVARSGPMSVQPALALAAGLAESLSAIHAAGVVHCDLKPSNVLLSPDGPRVIDFGISRAVEASSVPGVGWVVGSAGFMSPEQAMGEEVGPPSDIFSLGAVLTFAATGQGPFGRGSHPEVAYRLVYGPPDLDLVPAELRPLVERCLAKQPAGRPTADEVLESAAPPAAGWLPEALLGAFVPVPGQREAPGSPARARRPGRRWRPLTAGGLTAGVLAASVVVNLALNGTARHPPATPLAPKAAAAPAPSSASAVPGRHTAPPRSSSAPGPAATSAVIPDMATVTLPAPPASYTPSPTAPASSTTSKPPTPSPSPSPTGSSPTPSPTGSSPSPSPTGSSPSPSPTGSSPSPTDPSPTGSSPTGSSPTDPSPTDPSPTGSSPTDPSPTDPSPTGSSPTGSSPAGSSPTGSSPAGSSPTGSSPAGSSPTGSSPAGSSPAGSSQTGSSQTPGPTPATAPPAQVMSV